MKSIQKFYESDDKSNTLILAENPVLQLVFRDGGASMLSLEIRLPPENVFIDIECNRITEKYDSDTFAYVTIVKNSIREDDDLLY